MSTPTTIPFRSLQSDVIILAYYLDINNKDNARFEGFRSGEDSCQGLLGCKAVYGCGRYHNTTRRYNPEDQDSNKDKQ